MVATGTRSESAGGRCKVSQSRLTRLSHPQDCSSSLPLILRHGLSRSDQLIYNDPELSFKETVPQTALFDPTSNQGTYLHENCVGPESLCLLYKHAMFVLLCKCERDHFLFMLIFINNNINMQLFFSCIRKACMYNHSY